LGGREEKTRTGVRERAMAGLTGRLVVAMGTLVAGNALNPTATSGGRRVCVRPSNGPPRLINEGVPLDGAGASRRGGDLQVAWGRPRMQLRNRFRHRVLVDSAGHSRAPSRMARAAECYLAPTVVLGGAGRVGPAAWLQRQRVGAMTGGACRRAGWDAGSGAQGATYRRERLGGGAWAEKPLGERQSLGGHAGRPW